MFTFVTRGIIFSSYRSSLETLRRLKFFPNNRIDRNFVKSNYDLKYNFKEIKIMHRVVKRYSEKLIWNGINGNEKKRTITVSN